MTLRREFVLDDEVVRVQVQHLQGDRYVVHVGERRHEVEAATMPDGRVRLVQDGRASVGAAAQSGKDLQVRVSGHTWLLQPFRGRRTGAAESSGSVVAPMTGTVLQVLVQAGDTVAAGQRLVVLTAMKMEHKLVAPRAGTVVHVAVVAGATVDQGVVLVRLE